MTIEKTVTNFGDPNIYYAETILRHQPMLKSSFINDKKKLPLSKECV